MAIEWAEMASVEGSPMPVPRLPDGSVDYWRVWRSVGSKQAREFLRLRASQRYSGRTACLRALGMKKMWHAQKYWREHYPGFDELDEALSGDPRFAAKFYAMLSLPEAIIVAADLLGDAGESREKRVQAAKQIIAAAGEGEVGALPGKKKGASEWSRYLK